MKTLYLLPVVTLTLCACATTKGNKPKTPASAPAARGDASAKSLVGEESWMLATPGDCAVKGSGQLATTISCNDLGKASLEKAQSEELGHDVGALTLPKEPLVGGAFATLSHMHASYKIEPDLWQPIEAKVRTILTKKRIDEREAGYAKAPACENPGEVVHYYDSCPSVDGVATVCGKPVVRCGPPLATGEACTTHGACKSGKCGYKSGVCK